MADLGMHVVHVPFRLGWKPRRVFAQLQKIHTQRPDGKGGMAECDTWDNATLHCDVEIEMNPGISAAASTNPEIHSVPMRLEMKRMAPGEANTWYIEVL